LNFGKVLLLEKQAQVHAEKNVWAGIIVTQKLHEETWNAASNLCWQSVQDPCLIVFENCRCSWYRWYRLLYYRSSWRSNL